MRDSNPNQHHQRYQKFLLTSDFPQRNKCAGEFIQVDSWANRSVAGYHLWMTASGSCWIARADAELATTDLEHLGLIVDDVTNKE